jgi:hypothetical protein
MARSRPPSTKARPRPTAYELLLPRRAAKVAVPMLAVDRCCRHGSSQRARGMPSDTDASDSRAAAPENAGSRTTECRRTPFGDTVNRARKPYGGGSSAQAHFIGVRPNAVDSRRRQRTRDHPRSSPRCPRTTRVQAAPPWSSIALEDAAGIVDSRIIGVTFPDIASCRSRRDRPPAPGTVGKATKPGHRDKREMLQAGACRARTTVASQAASPVNCTRTIGL